MEIVSIQEIKQHARGHFFDKEATRFFASRYPQQGYKIGNKAYFVTSEQFHGLYEPDGARLYTIRVLDYDTGIVGKVGEFNKLTRYQAAAELKKILKYASASAGR